MNFSDIIFVAQWWSVLFIIGLVFLPLTSLIFSNFFDRGYIFARILGMALISYVVFVLGILKVLPFTELTIFLVASGFLIVNILISKSFFKTVIPSLTGPRLDRGLDSRFRGNDTGGSMWKIFLFEEALFFATLFFWSFIRSHQPEIHGLEKYMDFGFVNSIIRSEHLPPKDMWFPPLSINYYYFGHLITAILTKISTIPSFVTYNLMLSTIFAFTFTGAFSIGANLLYSLLKSQITNHKSQINYKAQKQNSLETNSWSLFGNWKLRFGILTSGLLSGFLVSLAGNLHAIYTFFKPYVNENPVPFWQLVFAFDSFPNSYWYPNATRFIYNTIHEFPIYSAVVSDLHGHYLDVPFVLLIIALSLSLILKSQITNHKQISNSNFPNSKRFNILDFGHWNLFGNWRLGFGILLLISFLLAIMYMTNAWDGIIYFLLSAFVLLVIYIKQGQTSPMEIKNDPFDKTQGHPERSRMDEKLKIKNSFHPPTGWIKLKIVSLLFCISIIAIGFFILSLPFNLYFKPFASGIGVLCAPEFLTKVGNFGPFLFETDHCQRSPLWQLGILYGFFYFWAISFIVLLSRNVILRTKSEGSRKILRYAQNDITKSDLFVFLLIIFSTLLIIIPEFIYVKDIYPGHYRANTMFKLVYQAFIMLSISSAYIIVRVMPLILSRLRNNMPNIFNFYFVFFIFSFLFFILVMIYPYFAINSYYGDLKTYYGLDGTLYLKNLYPTDYNGILWINKNIKGQPVILEAQGDSYTDYGRVSTNTGLPTVLGWTVHEWLWRGTYDIPAPRIPEVQKMYESEDLEETKSLLKKYNVSLVFFGDLERQKYPNLNEDKFKRFGKVIYQNGDTKIYDMIGL